MDLCTIHRHKYLLEITNKIKQDLVAFFVFGETAALFDIVRKYLFVCNWNETGRHFAFVWRSIAQGYSNLNKRSEKLHLKSRIAENRKGTREISFLTNQCIC
jgi:hypothetical protein